MARPTDPAALIERRRAAQAERAAEAEARWTRFQEANRKRYAGRVRKRPPPGLAHLLARGKTPGRVSLLSASGLWEPGVEVSLGSIPGPAVSLSDYVRAGPVTAAQPRALFDQAWYLANAPALAGSRWPLLAHYLIVGDGHNLSPHPLVDGPAYRARHGARMAQGRLTVLEHFLFEGAAEGAGPSALFDVKFYVGQSDEVAASGENPLIHYLRTGWREGLAPNPLFAGDWYLAQNPHARDAGIAPLLHYAVEGAAQGLSPHPLFDVAWYRKQRHAGQRGDPLSDFLSRGARELKSPTPLFQPGYYLQQQGGAPDARANPLVHYLTVGAFQGLWPAPEFDEPGYFTAHRDAAAAPQSALEHWARHRTARPAAGAAAGRAVSAEALFEDLRRATAPDPDAYDNAAYAALRRSLRGPPEDVRVIAIRRMSAPDWTAIARALPNYRGQVQPRLPADGFADPATAASLARDIALAERYGLGGFCHEADGAEAIAAILAQPFPFCIGWAGGSDARTALTALAPALASGQAIRVDGRPIVLVPADIDPAAWRKAAGGAGLYLVQCGGAPAPGFDAHLAGGPSGRAPEGPTGPVINPDFRGLVHDGPGVIGAWMAQPPAADALPLIVAAHDTTPLSQDAPVVWQGASPGAFQAWLEAARDQVGGRPADRRLVFVHAWNDWDTGAALAPDLRYGHGWLEAIANAADADLLEP